MKIKPLGFWRKVGSYTEDTDVECQWLTLFYLPPVFLCKEGGMLTSMQLQWDASEAVSVAVSPAFLFGQNTLSLQMLMHKKTLQHLD